MYNIVNKENPIPVYYQIEESIRRDIISGLLTAGERLPTEQQLCQLFGVSRMTVRRALQDLISDGIVERRRGHGPVVAPPRLVRPLSHISGLSDTMAAQGIHVTSKILSLETLPARAPEAEQLHIPVGEPVLFLRRLRLVEGSPIALQHTYLHRMVGPIEQFELEGRSLYHLLRDRGFHLGSATQKFTARMPTKAQCQLLEVPAHIPLLCTERYALLQNGDPLEVSRSWYNSSRYSVIVDLH